MPKMTGVEFCRAIRGLPVKTILLTGKASLETAISAFNEGVIDCFLQKQDSNVSTALRREIKRLQHVPAGSPEFSVIELYQAYAGPRDLMTLTENLLRGAARALTGSDVVEVYARATVRVDPAIGEAAGLTLR